MRLTSSKCCWCRSSKRSKGRWRWYKTKLQDRRSRKKKEVRGSWLHLKRRQSKSLPVPEYRPRQSTSHHINPKIKTADKMKSCGLGRRSFSPATRNRMPLISISSSETLNLKQKPSTTATSQKGWKWASNLEETNQDKGTSKSTLKKWKLCATMWSKTRKKSTG